MKASKFARTSVRSTPKVCAKPCRNCGTALRPGTRILPRIWLRPSWFPIRSEGFKVRAHLSKVNTEGLRKAVPKLWDRIAAGDEDFAKDLAQAILVSHQIGRLQSSRAPQ